ncbi:MAG: LacI family DNA-binding transcriptional regulator [Oscillibacter sp.]
MARMTIRDIARLAGVSVTTVSRALNNAPEINSQTRERVLQVCREQGYRSNLLARSLVSSRTRVLGVILPELSGPFHASIVLHLERYAQEQDYQIMLCCGRVGAARTAALFDFLVSHRVDGILLVSASSAAPDLLRRHARGRPPCCWGCVPDRYAPADQRCQHRQLCRRRHGGRIPLPAGAPAGAVSGPRRDSVTHVLRHQGFLTIARERGMEVETVFNPGAVSSAPNGYRLARQVFARPFPQTAVFAPLTPWPWVSSRRQTSWDWTFPAGSPAGL